LLEQVEGGQSGFVAADASASGLAQSIKKIFCDQTAYQNLSQRLLSSGSDWQWSEIAAKLLKDLGRWRAGRDARGL
jgi:hypothetical protein